MQRSQNTHQKVNPWKWAFTILLILVLSMLIFISLKITIPSTTQTQIQQTTSISKQVPFEVTMNKESFSVTINYFLHQAEKGTDIKYDFALDKAALLMGTTKVLGKKLTFTVYAQPFIDHKGNIVLKVKKIGIGSLNAPVTFVLSYIKQNYNLKGIIAINIKEDQITLQLDKLSGLNGIKIKAEKLDLRNNQIKFKVYIPEK